METTESGDLLIFMLIKNFLAIATGYDYTTHLISDWISDRFFKGEWIDWSAFHKAGGTDRNPNNRTVGRTVAGVCSLHLLFAVSFHYISILAKSR